MRIATITAVLIAILATGGGLWFFLSPQRQLPNPIAVSTPMPTPTLAPSPISNAEPPTPREPPPVPVPVVERYLSLAGSNTIGSTLGPELVRAWLTSKRAETIRSKMSASFDDGEIDATLEGKPIRVEVRAHGTATAFTSMAAGIADVGMASRPVRDAEVATLAQLGDMRGAASEHVLALDGVAVIVASSNPVAKLSRAELRRIFSGETRTWAAFGGPNRPIALYARDDRSGTYDTFVDLVLTGAPLSSARRFEDSAELEAGVAADPDGIGFVGLPYVKSTRALAVSDGAAAAMEPSPFSIKTESYPLSRRLFLYTAATPANPAVMDFVNFALSDAGQAVVRAARFVDLDLSRTPKPETPKVVTACRLSPKWTGDPESYCRLRDGAEQLGTSFRFRRGSADLDTRATQDLRRVLARIQQSPGRKVVLAGFSDSAGTYASNCALSQARAKAVASSLATFGLQPAETIGFCDELPVRDNVTPDGRDLNRRVDLFLR